jgi:hypothetical protein
MFTSLIDFDAEVDINININMKMSFKESVCFFMN